MSHNLYRASRARPMAGSLNALRKVKEDPPSDAIIKRNYLFNMEKKRQTGAVGRIEKINVDYMGLPSNKTFIMNAGISTPYNCAQHLSEGHCQRSAVALVNGKFPWDMHRPLTEDCSMQLLNLRSPDPDMLVNNTFWRTCSFVLGAALEKCFKDQAQLHLHSFPAPNVKSGSFVYDIALGVKSWEPNKQELRAISAEMVKLANAHHQIERIDVKLEVAQEIFEGSLFKTEQLPKIAQKSSGKVTLYRVGTHIDISRGPMMGNTSLLGKCSIPAVIKFADYDEKSSFFRVQGIALPAGIQINHIAYNILENRARKLNTSSRLPVLQQTENEEAEPAQEQRAVQ